MSKLFEAQINRWMPAFTALSPAQRRQICQLNGLDEQLGANPKLLIKMLFEKGIVHPKDDTAKMVEIFDDADAKGVRNSDAWVRSCSSSAPRWPSSLLLPPCPRLALPALSLPSASRERAAPELTVSARLFLAFLASLLASSHVIALFYYLALFVFSRLSPFHIAPCLSFRSRSPSPSTSFRAHCDSPPLLAPRR